MRAWKSKSLTTYNFCYICARDLISFPVDQKYESINENDKKIKIFSYLRLEFPKTFFRHPVYGCSVPEVWVGLDPQLGKRPENIMH